MVSSPTKTRKYCALCGSLVDNAVAVVCPNDGEELKQLNEDAQIGRVLSQRYRITGLLGTGGMGAVYRARHLMLDRDVAVKVLRIHLGDNEPERIRRFNQEGRVISALHHPNIIEAMDFGVDNGKVFLVMECVQGKALSDEIEQTGKLGWSRALPLFRQMCDALAYAHGKGIIHRDIKPSNVMLTRDEHGQEAVKLLDFGVAKILNGSNIKVAPVTKTGIVFGSPPYMSPEQCTGHAPDTRSDIYSFGCVMYETLTGRTPITGENSLEILHKQVIAQPPDFAQLSPAIKVPAGLEAIVFKALAKDIDNRYQTMKELGSDLSQLLLDPDYVPPKPLAEPPPPPTPQRQREYFMAAAVALLVISLVALLSPRSPLHRDFTAHHALRRLNRNADEQAMTEAVVTLTKTLYHDGKGKQAASLLKSIIQHDATLLPPNDPAMRDMRHIEAVLEQKNAQAESKTPASN